VTCKHENICPHPSCGDGELDPGERCDTGIAAGQTGACPTTCDDGDPCTSDVPKGTACDLTCENTPMQPNPVHADGCCPAGLTQQQDADCLPPCGPDRQENCVDTCADVTCPVGQVCAGGVCIPDAGLADYVGGGCDCHTGPGLPGGSALLLGGLLLGLIFVRRR
jgi:MYXO-CTERM domain-containing protein